MTTSSPAEERLTLSPHDERELLLRYRPWLRRVAANMTSPSRAEDLAQEGWVEIWRATSSYDGSAPLDWWLKRKAHGRMLNVVRNWRSRRNVYDPVDDVEELVQLTAMIGNIEIAYHRGEIVAAMNRLTPREREYFFLRFWGGYNSGDLIKHFGYEPRGLWRTGREKLVSDLGHLVTTS